LNKLDTCTLESENPKEYWSLVNSLKTDQKGKPENTIDGETWLKSFSKLATVQDNTGSLGNIFIRLAFSSTM
jgi:hypothetical protein